MNTDTSLITEVAADVLSREVPEVAEGELSPLWPTLVELDWPAISIDSALGGADGSFVDLVSLVSTTAAHGVSVPLAEAAVARWVLARAGHDLQSPLVVCAAGETLDRVPWARHASHLVTWSEQDGAELVDLRGDGVSVEPGLNLAGEPRDNVHLAAHVERTPLPGAPARSVVFTRSALLNTAALTGAARGACELTREHVTRREQFGRPLIALKAVANGLAGMRTTLISAEAALNRALTETPDGTAPEATATAKVAAASAAGKIARAAHQLHGAMGVTREHPLHHVTRKLWAWRDECGSQRTWATELGRRALAAGETGVWDQLTASV